MTLLTAWCALRFGEMTELRRGDIDLRWHDLCHTGAVLPPKPVRLSQS